MSTTIISVTPDHDIHVYRLNEADDAERLRKHFEYAAHGWDVEPCEWFVHTDDGFKAVTFKGLSFDWDDNDYQTVKMAAMVGDETLHMFFYRVDGRA